MNNCLVVEDVAEVRAWLTGLLQTAYPECSAVGAECLSDAHRRLQAGTQDLVLIDLSLPDGDGSALISYIKSRWPETLCVVVTIFDNAAHLFPALRAGADGYLLKSDSEQQLLDALSGIMQGKPPLSASVAQSMLKHFQTPPALESNLTQREEELLILIANGYSVPRSAESMGISNNTACGYLKTVYQKLQVSNRAEATLKAVHLGLIDPMKKMG